MAIVGVLNKSYIIDLIILSVEALIVLLVSIFGTPYYRGFSCADISLRMPYKNDTVSVLVLGVSFLIGGILLIIAVETILVVDSFLPSFIKIRNKTLPVWAVQSYRSIVSFLCGAGICQIITDVAKYNVGGLRPNFFEVCQPRGRGAFAGMYCSDPNDPFKFIGDYDCTSKGYSQYTIKDAHLSFPSGHASLSFYTALYLMSFIQKRFIIPASNNQDTNLGFFLLKPFLQGLVLIAAWFTSISRLKDFKHHLHDVVTGITIGVISATLIIYSLRPFERVRDTRSIENRNRDSVSPTATCISTIGTDYTSLPRPVPSSY